MNRFEALVSLNLIGEIGSTRLKKLLDYFDRPQDILNAPIEKLKAVACIGENIAKRIHFFKKEDLEKELDLAGKLNLKIITLDDKEYPENLKYISDPPIVLYVKGSLMQKDKFSLAIVGSRRASFYGLNAAEKFAADLSSFGFTIVSGMARGIDTSAHRGVLKSRGRTIAVMGSGFNYIYPPENRELVEEIIKNGAVISEFPVDTKPMRQNFPRRNRVISGLSLGTVIVEAARNSGALITADFALEQGREVFAIPGKINTENSFGTNELIKQGAKLTTCVEDILEEFDLPNIDSPELYTDFRRLDSEKDLQRPASENILHNKEDLLYSLISEQPIFLDEIAQKTNLDIPQLSDILLRLQIKRLIRQLPGKQFIRT